MIKPSTLRAALIVLAGSLSAMVSAVAESAKPIDIPAGRLSDALIQLSKQYGIDLFYRPEQVSGLKTKGVHGELTTEEAVAELIKGTKLRLSTDATGAMVIGLPETGAAKGSANNSDSPVTGEQEAAAAKVVQATGTGEAELQKEAPTEGEGDAGGAKLEEIVVTAQKRKERVIDVPMSVTAMSGDELIARRVTNIRDLSYAVPGLSVSESGPGRQIISIRGIAGQRGASSLTGVYLDEMPLSGVQDGFTGSAYADLRVIDLDRVEVLKGPQGTLFGEGAAGGVIRFITKDPDLGRVGGDISTEFLNTEKGKWGEEVTGVLNIPVARDVFGVRVAAKYENTSGWIDQPSTGRTDINDSETKHVRVKALYVPTEDLRIKAMAEIHRNSIGASNEVNQFPLKDSIFVQAFDRQAPTGATDNYDMFNLVASYKFNFGELLSSTSHAQMDSVQSFTQFLGSPGMGVVNGVPVGWFEGLVREYPFHSRITSEELRLTSLGRERLNWTVGSIYKDATLTSGFSDRGLDAIAWGFLPLPGISKGQVPSSGSKAWAGFADASYQVADRFTVGGGLRYYSEKSKKILNESVANAPATSISYSKTTYRAYLRYTLSPDANLYFNMGNGFRSGGLNSDDVVVAGGPRLILPETTLFYELGAKAAMLGHRLQIKSALYYGQYNDMLADRLTVSPVDGITPLQYTANGQDARIKGGELEAGWAATERLTLTLVGDVTHTKITKIDTSVPPVYALGDPITYVPKYHVATSVDYRFHWRHSQPGFFLLSFGRQGKSYNTERNNALLGCLGARCPPGGAFPYQVAASELNFLNASVGGEWSGWTWSVFGTNLLDEDHLLSPTVSGWSSQARPRALGVGFGKRFD